MAEWAIVTAPGALPILGHALKLRQGLLRYLETLATHGDLVRIHLGPWPVYLACHPDLVQQILLQDRIFDKGGPIIDKLRDGIGNGLATCPHSDHRRQRRLLQPAFHRNRMESYAKVMSDQITAVLDSWHDGQVVDVPAQAYQLSGSTISRTLFTSKSAVPAARAMQHCLEPIMADVFRRSVIPPNIVRFMPGTGRAIRAHQRMWKAIDATIAAYRQEGIDHGDLLSALLSARDENGQPLNDDEIHDQVYVMLVAGIETSAATLCWALDLLARNPDVLTKLHAEVDAVLGGRVAVWEDLSALPLTGRVINESLRLYPPAWLVTRTVTEETQLAGHVLPAGSAVAYSPYILHRRADSFPSPGRFDPSRWLPNAESPPPRNTFIPFAAGPRKCIGDTYAVTVVTLALASITARWSLEPTSAAPAVSAPRLALAPKRLRMRLRQRGLTRK